MRLVWAIIGSILLTACNEAQPSQQPAPAATALSEVSDVDDSLMGDTPEHFFYTGRWEHVSGRADGRTQGTSSRSWHAGDTVIFTYRGSLLRIYGVKGPKGGNATAAIDGIQYGTVSFYSPRVQSHAVVFQGPALAEGIHTFGLIVNHTPNYPHRGFVNIDGARIVQEP